MNSYSSFLGGVLSGIASRRFQLLRHEYCADSSGEVVLLAADAHEWRALLDEPRTEEDKGNFLYPIIHIKSTKRDYDFEVDVDILLEIEDREMATRLFLERVNLDLK